MYMFCEGGEEEGQDESGGADNMLHGYHLAELERAARKLSVQDVARLLTTSFACRQSDVTAFAKMGVDGAELLRLVRHPPELRAMLESARCPRRRQDNIQRELRNFPTVLWGIHRQGPCRAPRPPAPSAKGVGLGCGLTAPEDIPPPKRGYTRLAAALARSSAFNRQTRRCAAASAHTEDKWKEVAPGQWQPRWREGWLERVEAALDQRRARHADANAPDADEDSYHRRVRAFQTRARKEAEEQEVREKAAAAELAAEEARIAREQIEAQGRKLAAERAARANALRQHDRERREWMVKQRLNKARLDAEIDSAVESSKRENAGGPPAEKGRRVSIVTREEGVTRPRTADVGTCVVGPHADDWSPISEVSVAHKEAKIHRMDNAVEGSDSGISPRAILFNESDSL